MRSREIVQMLINVIREWDNNNHNKIIIILICQNKRMENIFTKRRHTNDDMCGAKAHLHESLKHDNVAA